MVESIVTVVVEVAKCLVPPTERRLGYLRNYNANFENLKLEFQKLKDESCSIQRRVSEAERNGEKIEEKVEKWLLSADKIIIEAGEFIADEETTNKLCLKGLCPDFKSRYQLSKKAVTELKAIVELREEAGRFDRISYRIIPEEIWLKSHKGYEAFESRLSTLNSIQKALTDLSVSMIGVYGMGGIGKTTLVKEVARQARDDKLFDQVVFSEVSQTPDIRKIQQEIAEKLGMELPDETESRRASRLYERLKKEKKILVVLDNTWKYLDLDTVGIPFGDDHKGCKLLLTSRDRDVLLSMGSKDNFSIGVLYEEEAWRLFRMMAGGDVENRKLKPTATDVAKACGGLPFALTTIARALRNKSVLQWKIALQELQTPSMVNFKGVPTDAYSTIELSFKYLQGEQLKRTLFLCSLFAPLSIKDLFKYGMGLGIFHGVHNMEYAHKQLYALVHRLKDSCLLLDGDSSIWLSMHDVVRHVAISIACRDQNAFVVRNEDLWGWPNEDALKKCYAICLRNNNIHELPQGLECPQLEFLYISSKDSSVEINIPESFFIGMRKLKVIDLTRMQLFSLPSSIDLLVNLQTLCLDQCMLGDIAIIGKWKNLEILSFLQSDIVQLPKELGQLTKLRLLDLTDCLLLKVIASNVISSLTRLEELYMRNCSIEWEVEGPNSERSNASLDELVHLPRLTTLEIDVKNDNILPEGFFARKLERFKISVGDASFLPPIVINNDFFRYSRELFSIEDQETFRTLKLKLISNTICSKKLSGIKNVEYLCLDKLQSVKNIIFELDMEGFSQLMHLHVQNNSDFLCIVESTKKVPCDAFPLLESLTLYNLINLERICHDRLRVGSFNELRTLKVEDCDQLCNIFLLSTAKCLPRLERIAVIDCSNMKAIFVVIEESDFSNNNAINKIEFAQLSSLSLGRLPELTGFCCEVKTPNDHLIILEDKLDSPTTLFNETVVLPKLEVLELCEINVEKIWHNQLPTLFPRFQRLTRLIVWRCQKLKCIFSASMVRSLEQLQHLEIYCCKALQVIISEEGADQVTPTFVFPHLTSLMLTILPELRCIYPAMLTSERPVLKELRVFGCDQLDITRQWPLFLFVKIFSKLERLGLTGKDIRMFRQIDFPQYFFGNLKYLDVLGDDSASFPLDLLQRFHNLESLLLLCSSYKEILSNGGDLDKYVGKLAKIKYLELNRLNNLKQLWKQDSIMDSIFQYLDNLHVHYCDSLLILLPSSSASFLNLTELHIFGCKELINLVTSSTAKSLARLVTMQVLGCRAMTEVILSEGDAAEKEEIVFAKLKKLSLVDLDSLTSFCSENYTFKFPSLEDLLVFGCPNMKIFTAGELSTPPRIDVWYCDTPYERRWDGDINTTIRLLHQQKARLDATHEVANLRRQRIDSKLIACAYLEATLDIMDTLILGYEDGDVTLTYAAIARECICHQSIARYVLESRHIKKFFSLVQNPNFDTTSDAQATFKRQEELGYLNN